MGKRMSDRARETAPGRAGRKIFSFLCALLPSLLRQRAGTVIVAFAIMAPVIIGTGGAAMDFAEAYLVRQRLGNALDASALAAAASSSDPDTVRDRVHKFFEANYPEDKIGVTYDLDVRQDGDDVTVSAKADYNTSFLRVLGIDKITVSRSTTVNKQVRGLEVVMVLDNTTSMDESAGNHQSKMEALKAAALTFTDTLMGKDGHTNNTVKMGMVPYSSSVNVGPYGLGKTPAGGSYDGGYTFVNNPDGLSYNMNSSNAWHGCILEYGIANENMEFQDPNPSDTTNLTEAGDGDGPWNMYRKASCSNKQSCASSVNGSCKKTSTRGPGDCIEYGNGSCTRSHQEQGSCRKWNTDRRGNRTTCKTYNYTTVCDEYQQVCTKYCTSYNQICTRYETTRSCSVSSPNTYCPVVPIQPLTTSKQSIVSAINAMTSNGYTLSNIGMVWGYRVISPERPFAEGAAWDDKNWRKVLILMTDGMNSMSGYTAYGPPDLALDNIDNGDLDTRLSDTCENMKTDGISIYTVTFSTAAGDIDETTQDLYRGCATSPDKYYHAPTQEALATAFENIGKELANLHISQ
jgi:Flp pilus assembly protein TadG